MWRVRPIIHAFHIDTYWHDIWRHQPRVPIRCPTLGTFFSQDAEPPAAQWSKHSSGGNLDSFDLAVVPSEETNRGGFPKPPHRNRAFLGLLTHLAPQKAGVRPQQLSTVRLWARAMRRTPMCTQPSCQHSQGKVNDHGSEWFSLFGTQRWSKDEYNARRLMPWDGATEKVWHGWSKTNISFQWTVFGGAIMQ